jgi:hypothetical protein
MRRISLLVGLILFIFRSGNAQENRPGNFEVIFRGNGDIVSYIYFDQDNKYFIDTELNASVETIRYKRFFLAVDLFEETSMGRKPTLVNTKTNMVFDPNRAHWSFGLTGRFEFEKHFAEWQFHHDCWHGVDRFGYEPTPTNPTGRDSTKYWNVLRFGFGNLGYLPKYRYHQPEPGGDGLVFANKLNYFALASFFTPRGYSWQKYHGYDFTLNTNLHYIAFRFKRLDFDIESNNLWIIDYKHDLKRKHGLNFNFTIYGNHGILSAYIGWWPYDNQLIRNRDGKTVFGLHLGF